MTIDPTSNAGAEPGRDPADELIGRVVAGRYRIIAHLGTGAMGAVYVGEHLRMGRRDAIKVLRQGMARDPEAVARFTRGARNVATIRHPNVCTIYDFSDTDDGLQFLAMEYVEGETLKDTLDREGRLEPQRAADIARQVAAALQAAHDVGIVHRDLKPGNIMIARRADGGDAVKVVDFDIAKGPAEAEGDEVTRMGFVVGTPEYMSPEQLMGEKLDGRSDVYSLGIVLFRMLTGMLPFRATSTQEIMVQRLTVEPLRLHDALPATSFPPALDALLTRSLARASADRHPDAATFAAELDRALGAPSGTATAGGPARVDRPTDDLPPTRLSPAVAAPNTAPATAPAAHPFRRPALLAAGVVLVAALAAGATVLYNSRGDASDAVSAAEPAPLDPLPATPDIVTDGGAPADDVTTAPDPTAGDTRPDPVGPTPEPSTPRLPMPLNTLIERQFAALNESPGPARLRAIRDTGGLAWAAATVPRDSAAAALLLAQAALIAGDDAECARWARRGAAVDPSGFDMLLEVCR
jgi:hypothetical protein